MTFLEAKSVVDSQYRTKTIREYNEIDESIKEESNRWFLETTGWTLADFLKRELDHHLGVE